MKSIKIHKIAFQALVICLFLNIPTSAQSIFEAIDNHDAELVEKLAGDKTLIDSVNKAGYTPLVLCAYRGDLELVTILINQGANINYITKQGTALHGVAYKGDLKMSQFLLERGANPNMTDQNKTTPLMYATLFKHVSLAKLLLKFGADPTLRDHTNRSSIDHAKSLELNSLVELFEETR